MLRYLALPFKPATGQDVDKYAGFIGWAIILLTIVSSFSANFQHTVIDATDEIVYLNELNYLSSYGLYNALTQGTSVLYSVLIFTTTSIFSIDFILAAKFLSVLFFILSCRVLLKCFDLFEGLNILSKYFGVTVFCALCKYWLWKGMPDIVCCFFILASFRQIFLNKPLAAFWGGLLLFCAFAIKPVALFVFPFYILSLAIYRNNRMPWLPRMKKISLFIVAFTISFVLYHIPGYLRYGKLMLEDKNHYYVGKERQPTTPTWNELNVYFEAYKNEHKKPNKWAVTFEEVAAFKKTHPGVNLNLSYTDFVSTYPALWFGNVVERVASLGYYTQTGIFIFKYTSINRWIGNLTIIKGITLLVFLIFLWLERSFIRRNFSLFIPPLFYYLVLAVYCIPQLESNWLIWCLPFLALPVVRFLGNRIHFTFLFLIQAGYILLVMNL